MKTKLLLSTAIVAAAFTSNAIAADWTVTKEAKYLPAGTYDKIDIDTGVVFFSGNSNEVGGDYAKAKEVYIHNDFLDYEHNPLDDVTITYDHEKFGGGDGKPSLEYPFQIGQKTLEVEGTFKAENTRFDVATATLIADKIDTENTDITTMGFGHEEGNDFILAGKNYKAEAGYTKTHILTNEITLNVTGPDYLGIGDDRVNFIVKDGVTLNLQGKAGMSARSIVDNWEDYSKGIDKELNQKIIDGYGNLTIEGGTVNLSGNSGMLADNDITISGGTVNFNDNSQIFSLSFFGGDENDYTFKDDNDSIFKDWGILWGANGNFRMTGGTVNINGDNKITGKDYVTIAGGTLNINKGATLSNVSLNGNSFGNAGFMVTDSGVMNIKGTLNSVANIEGSSPVAVGNGGILKLSNNNAKIMSAVGVLNKGTLDIGLYTPTVTGPVIFGRGGTLGVKVNSATEHGVLNANVIFKDGASVTISTDKSMKVGDKWNNLALVKGTVAAENKDLSNGRFNVVLNNAGKFDIEYTKSAHDRVEEAGGSASEMAAADAWDGLDVLGGGTMADIKNLLDDLSQYNAKGYVEALKTLAPTATPMVQQTSSETVNQVFGAVGSRLSGGSTNSSQGMSSGDALEDSSLWVQGLANHAKLNKTSQSDGFKSDTFGTAMGLEKKVSNQVKAGIGYAYNDTDVKATGRDTDVTTHTALVYGEYKPSNWFVNGIMSYGWSDYDESKNVAGNIVTAKYDAETFGLQAMTGYDFYTKYATITPEAGLRYIHVKTDGYTDSASQTVSGNDSDIITGVIGSRVRKTFDTQSGLRFTPEAKLAMTYDLKHDNVTSNVTLPNGSSYSVNGKALDRFGIEVGGNVTAEINDNVELSLGYEGKFREDYQDHSGLINFKYNF